MLRIKGTAVRVLLTVALADYLPSGVGGMLAWESASIATERSDGGNDCSLPYRFSLNLLEGDGSAGALEHNGSSKVSSCSAAEDADRSLPYSL